MVNKLKISIIVPVYNAEKYLKRCLDSILAQTYSNFEVLLIDDGSTDNSGNICDEYELNDNRVRVIHKENSGVSATRNLGIAESSGDYIAFVDSDDYIKSNMLEKMVKKAEENNSDIIICDYFTDKDGEIIKSRTDFKRCYDNANNIKNELLYLFYTDYHNGLYSLWNKLIKKSLCDDNNIFFDVSLKRGEDAWFIFECLKHCKIVDYISQAFYYYYQNQNSIMHSLYNDQYEHWVKNRKRLLYENQALGFNIDYNLFYKDFLYKVAVYCKDLSKHGCVVKVKEILSDEFYVNTAKYAAGLPMHIMFLTRCVQHRIPVIAMIMYRFWALF